LALLHATVQQALPPTDLKVEYLVNPLGVDTSTPRFFWVDHHKQKDQQQTAYQIEVLQNWDSGKIFSNQTAHVFYNGSTPLRSNTVYQWRVKWWDKQGTASDWSELANFHIGLLKQEEWKGKWLTGDLLRKNFTITSEIKNAFAYISGIGYSNLYINGHKVGNEVLNPAWTTYNKRSLYSTYDVGSLLGIGENVIGIELGNGWYGHRKNTKRAIFQLSIVTSTGPVSIISDESWKTHSGPITYDDVYNGETYDARLEQDGWNNKNFIDKSWTQVTVVAPPGGVLSSQLMQPIRPMKEIKPIAFKSPVQGMYIVDFGQNFSGWARLRVQGPAGTKVVIRFAEVLNKNGTIYTTNLRSAKATDTYILRGSGTTEVYEPRFTYHGFRFAEVTGYPGTFSLDALLGVHVYSSVPSTGNFQSSEKVLNQIQSCILWGQTSNLMGIPTDCPQRDERLGWTADAVLAAEEAVYNFDMGAFYSNFVRDIFDNQNSGESKVPGVLVSDIVPGGLFPAGNIFTFYIYMTHDHRSCMGNCIY
jgi:alpha-L-rhamnosidase